jgi:Flp pilus assembly protein TadG
VSNSETDPFLSRFLLCTWRSGIEVNKGQVKSMKIPFKKRIMQGTRAQAMVEFALVLMILMVVLVGILEVGRLLFIYAAVNNASREAARYASAIGLDDNGNSKYQYCDGIRNMARRSAFFTPLTISISYDHGPGTGSYDTCDGSVDTGVVVNAGSTFDRVQVQVSAQYDPMVSLIPIDSRTITSSSARTILGYVDLDLLTSSSPNTPVPTIPTTPGTGVSSPTPTDTATPTPTATDSDGVVITLTPLPSNTPTQIPTITSTATSTSTATPTATPTGTSTPSSSCSTITASDIRVIDNTNVISMTITNPYTEVTVSGITLIWNKNGGAGNPETLTLDKVNIGTTFWSGLSNSSGAITLAPVSPLSLPGNNANSTITFTFVENYKASSMSGTTTITINLSTPGCSAITGTAK